MIKLRKLWIVAFLVISVIIFVFSLRVVGIIDKEGVGLKILQEEHQNFMDKLKVEIAEKEAMLTEAITEKMELEGFVDDLEIKIEEIVSSLEQERKKSYDLLERVDELIKEGADIEDRHKMELALLEEELCMAIAKHELQVLAMTPAKDPTMFTGVVVAVYYPDYLAIGIYDLVAEAGKVEILRRGDIIGELLIKEVFHATLLLRVPPWVSLKDIIKNDKAEVFLLPNAEDIMSFLENGKVTDVIVPNFLNVDLGTAASLWQNISVYRNGVLVGRIIPEEIYLSVIMEAPDVKGIRRGDDVKIIR